MGLGRPTVYSEEIADEILRRLADGESLTRICSEERMPARSTVYFWRSGRADAPPEFSDNYAQAREAQAERYFDEVLDLADGLEGDHVSVSNEVTNARRVRIDSRKWVLARMNRAKYGEKSAHEISGPAGGELRFRWRDTPPVSSGGDDDA